MINDCIVIEWGDNEYSTNGTRRERVLAAPIRKDTKNGVTMVVILSSLLVVLVLMTAISVSFMHRPLHAEYGRDKSKGMIPISSILPTTTPSYQSLNVQPSFSASPTIKRTNEVATASPTWQPSMKSTKQRHVSDMPSHAPMFRPSLSSFLSVSSHVSSNPSIFSPNVPSELPSEVPSESPSRFLSNFLSNFPSNFPSKLQSKFPSEYPSGIPSTHPSEYPSEHPSKFLSVIPSEFPSQIPSVSQTKFPSIDPTIFPKATLNPTDSQINCIDSPGFYYNHKGDKVSCDWINSAGSFIQQQNCGKTNVGLSCPLACSDYNECTRLASFTPKVSPASSKPTHFPSKTLPETLTFVTTGDATVKETSPNSSLGSASWLKIDADSGIFHVLLQFDLYPHDTSRPLISASLRLRALSNCPSGGYFEKTTHPYWNERNITWANAPDGDGIEIARFGAIKSGYWYAVDIESALRSGEKKLSLRLYPVSTNQCIFASKENSIAHAPEIRIVYG